MRCIRFLLKHERRAPARGEVGAVASVQEHPVRPLWDNAGRQLPEDGTPGRAGARGACDALF